MATTTGGTTYVTSTDLVADYPTASLALANRVDVVASGGPNSIKTSGYTITLADILGGNKFLYNSASPGTFTLPTSGLVDGMTVNVAQIGAGALTVSGGTIVGTAATTAQYQSLQFVYASTGTTWYSVAPPSALPGLAIVTPTSIANSGGSASVSGGAVTFTGVTSLSLNGVFSATYDNYRIMVSYQGTTDGAFYTRLRASGTDSTASYNRQRLSAESTTVSADRATSQSTGEIGAIRGNLITMSVDLFNPYVADWTEGSFVSTDPIAGAGMKTYNLLHQVSSAFDGITFYPGTSTITGKVRVYGYKNS